MKKAIKVLEKRIESLRKEFIKVDKKFENYTMVCEHDFLTADLSNIELEINELQKAIEILNKNTN
jgi:uncharacterized protein YPO0396